MTDIPYSCFWDKAINYVELENVENNLGSKAVPLTCWKCGKVNFPNAVKKATMSGHEGENYLECIAYTGPLKNVPTGAITVDGITQYITTDGRAMSRGEFIAEFGSDPAEHIAESIKIYRLFHVGRRRRR